MADYTEIVALCLDFRDLSKDRRKDRGNEIVIAILKSGKRIRGIITDVKKATLILCDGTNFNSIPFSSIDYIYHT